MTEQPDDELDESRIEDVEEKIDEAQRRLDDRLDRPDSIYDTEELGDTEAEPPI